MELKVSCNYWVMKGFLTHGRDCSVVTFINALTSTINFITTIIMIITLGVIVTLMQIMFHIIHAYLTTNPSLIAPVAYKRGKVLQA